MNDNYLTIDNKKIKIENERNLLEVIRKANIELPTFCYHSDLSIYGACRLCIVDVEGRGINAACSTPPEAGMKVRTNTEEIREIRKINIELLLANHEQKCPTCIKSSTCGLQKLARLFGIEEVRFNPTVKKAAIDFSSPSIVRDPNKCILCGDCVRACKEIQGIGAIDFAHRGAEACVMPPFGMDLDEVECVNCGQCAAVCPTGALSAKSEINAVWKDINNPEKVVVAEIAPAVRVAIGEYFGYKPGAILTGQIAAALKLLGFDYVYDTCFAADFTVIEEATEFLKRKEKGGKFPMFTSCCPAWVKYAEQFYPDLLENLSSCRSPQQMFGALAKDLLPSKLNIKREKLSVVSIMPCTAKKMESKLPKFAKDGIADVDHVLTTEELGRMIEGAGIKFENLDPESLDMPMGFKTGAGMIFGATGGVSEAVLRFASEQISGNKYDAMEFAYIRGTDGIRETEVEFGDTKLRLAIVHGLANAAALVDKIKSGEKEYDLIEVMACPGGCVGGAGQPLAASADTRKIRTKAIYDADKMLQLHKSQDNHIVGECYKNHVGKPNGKKAHELFHTAYTAKKRTLQDSLTISEGTNENKISVSVCAGTSCFLKGAQALIRQISKYIDDNDISDSIDLNVTFCTEKCSKGPNVRVGETEIEKCTFETAVEEIHKQLKTINV